MADLPSELAAALLDRYALEHELGHGGMATVYLARDLKHDRPVALKIIRPELSSRAGSERFQREIAFAARLQHPHILPLLDSGKVVVGRSMTLLYYVMPYVEGQSLRERLRQESRLPLDEALRIAHEAAQALQYAHEHGVIHRDVKPENLLLTSDGNTLVADFGIARALSGGDDRLTETGLAIGTPQYMSPEQATAGEVDARTDQYSLACVVYEMLSGEPPFTGPTPQAVIAKSLNAPRPSLRLVRESVPAGLDSAVTRAVARDPMDRFPSVAAFAEAFGRAAASVASPVASSAPGSTPRVPRRASVLIGASILLVAGLAATLLLRSRHEGPVAPEAEVIAVLPFRASGAGLAQAPEARVRVQRGHPGRLHLLGEADAGRPQERGRLGEGGAGRHSDPRGGRIDGMKNLIIKLLANAVALAAASWLVGGITLQGATTGRRVLTLLIVAAIFGAVNAVVKPIAKLLSLPFIILTLGLLIFVINALMLLLTSWITGKLDVQFHVDGFVAALLGSLVITLVGMLLNLVLPDKAEIG